MLISEAIEAVTRLVSCYPNGGSQAGKSYIGAVASLLCQYPRSVAIECADPFRGLARECRFLPTMADVVAWCDPRIESMKWTDNWELRSQMQLEERERIEYQPPASPEFLQRMKDELAAHGIHILGSKSHQTRINPEDVMAKYGLTREQWNAIPDQPIGSIWHKAGA